MCLVSLINLPQPPTTWSDDQCTLLYLAYTCIDLHVFTSCPGPFRGNVGLCWSYSDPLPRVCCLVWPWFVSLYKWGWLVASNKMLGFLLGCVPSPFSWKISSAVSIFLHCSTSSLILLLLEPNPWTGIWFWHSWWRVYLASLIILLPEIPWAVLNGGKCSSYLTI